MRFLRALLRLIRLDSSLLAFLAVFIPLFARTGEAAQSFRRAIPLLLIFFCTFIANDLDDIEKDKKNHPDRPLVTGYLTETFATGLFFVALGGALFSTRYYVEPDVAFLYYSLIALTISYGYVTEYLPSIKAGYVSVVATLPLAIVVTFLPHERRLYFLPFSFLLVNLGRELCMDIRDREGDPRSLIHLLQPYPLSILAFSIQGIGIMSLALQISKVGDAFALALMAIALIAAASFWFKYINLKLAVFLMKLPFFLGLYLLM